MYGRCREGAAVLLALIFCTIISIMAVVVCGYTVVSISSPLAFAPTQIEYYLRTISITNLFISVFQ